MESNIYYREQLLKLVNKVTCKCGQCRQVKNEVMGMAKDISSFDDCTKQEILNGYKNILKEDNEIN